VQACWRGARRDEFVQLHTDRLEPTAVLGYVLRVYFALELSRSMVQPLNFLAGAVRSTLEALPEWGGGEFPLKGPMLASAELLEAMTRRYEKQPFRLTSAVVDGAVVSVSERVALETPFCRLVHFDKGEAGRTQPRLLVVAPLSGHHATLLRETVQEMLPDHDVYLTDWVDARLVPSTAGTFDLNDYIDLVRQALRTFDDPVHILAVCQPCVPVLAAVAVMSADGDPKVPATMTLVSGPIDPRISPTKVNQFAQDHSTAWLDTTVVYRVPPPLAGFGRRVYPGALQLQAFVSLDVSRHVEAHVKHFFNVASGDAAAVEKHRRFYDEYFAVLDMPAEFYLQTVAEVFQEYTLPRGEMLHRGTRVRPETITRTALLTVEGEKDDITGLGQTEAAHALCAGIPAARKEHHVQAGVGHYGTFSGRRWREEIAPVIRRFVRAHESATA
jgi:poly(3-hydroxybutyrate) depolymerase